MPKVKVQEEQAPTRPDVAGRELISNHSGQHTVQLMGYKGSGKTVFYLKELDRVSKIIYTELTSGDELDWSKNPSGDIVDETSARICMRVMDCDVEGVAKLLERSSIVPPRLIDNDTTFRKWKIRQYDERTEFEIANDALVTYVKDMQEHNHIFPNYNYARFLVLENEGMLYNACKDYYVAQVEPNRAVNDLTDLYIKTRKSQQQTGKFGVEFPQGPRETYGKGIYPLLIRFFKALTSFTDDYGYNVYSTVLLMDKIKDYGKPTQHTAIEPMGKPDLTQQFFDYILWLFKRVERDENDPYNTKVSYWTDTATYGKCRTAPDVILPNLGPGYFWEFIELARQKEEEAWRNGQRLDNVLKTE